jgi:hypothetical protein
MILIFSMLRGLKAFYIRSIYAQFRFFSKCGAEYTHAV